MPKKFVSPLSSLSLQVRPVALDEGSDSEEAVVFQAYRLDLQVEGKQLLAPDAKLLALDGIEFWLSQRYNRKAWPLTCTCGVPECAGFWEPVTTSRKAGILSWTFPAHYFAYLRQQGLVTGRPRVVTLHFDAKQFYVQFDQALETIRRYEEESGKPSSFEAGSYGAPNVRLHAQFARAQDWLLKRTKHQRFARLAGTPAGQCAGAPKKPVP
jgi:hypothetical protein